MLRGVFLETKRKLWNKHLKNNTRRNCAAGLFTRCVGFVAAPTCSVCLLIKPKNEPFSDYSTPNTKKRKNRKQKAVPRRNTQYAPAAGCVRAQTKTQTKPKPKTQNLTKRTNQNRPASGAYSKSFVRWQKEPNTYKQKMNRTLQKYKHKNQHWTECFKASAILLDRKNNGLTCILTDGTHPNKTRLCVLRWCTNNDTRVRKYEIPTHKPLINAKFWNMLHQYNTPWQHTSFEKRFAI